MLRSGRGLRGVEHDLKELPQNRSLVMKGELMMAALCWTFPVVFLFKVLGSALQSRAMDHFQLWPKSKKMPGFTFLCPFMPLSPPHPVLPHKLSVLFTIPLSPPWEQCVCSPPQPPPPHPFIPFYPSIHLFGALCDISAMPGYEGERERQALPLSPAEPTEYQ